MSLAGLLLALALAPTSLISLDAPRDPFTTAAGLERQATPPPARPMFVRSTLERAERPSEASPAVDLHDPFASGPAPSPASDRLPGAPELRPVNL